MEYDVIGDVHGFHVELWALLGKMGYLQTAEDHFKAPAGRRAIYIGDLIDRGPSNLLTVRTVQSMVASGDAEAILGNRDYNAVQWATPRPDEPGEFVRKHRQRHFFQHKRFLEEVEGKPELHLSIVDWLKTVPVYLKRGNYRFVHACWSPTAIIKLHMAGMLDRGDVLRSKVGLRRLTGKVPLTGRSIYY